MLKESIKGPSGYEIPCMFSLHGESQILISAHGFGSCKTSATSMLLHNTLPDSGIGVVSFDFPAHGESGVDGSRLRIANCLDDLGALEAEVLCREPAAEIVYFGSSFGAYITALYLSLRGHKGNRAFFRSAAVTMPDLLLSTSHPVAEESIRENGWFMLALPGSDRPLKITREFLEDLRRHDLFSLYRSDTKLTMIHGDSDSVAPYSAAVRFAQMSGAQLITVPGGEHNLAKPGQPQAMVSAVINFVSESE
ncbi:MAG: alpha/beta hydrolase family protein [Oscillospiraceae bacterium]